MSSLTPQEAEAGGLRIRCLSSVETLSKQSIMTAKGKPRKHSLDEMWNPGWEAGLEKRTVRKRK